MEFDHVGKHCQVSGCGQKDFLPFVCDCCSRVYCLEHRKYELHACTGAKQKDMTSVDCPICGKSVKFSANQDANLAWDDHYMNMCIQKPAVVKAKTTCSKRSCNTILGPSNTFKCLKCHQSVCLSHRIAEDHDCPAASTAAKLSTATASGSSRASFLDRVESSKSVPAKSTASKPKPTKRMVEASDPTNTLKGTAQRRMQQQSGADSNSASKSIAGQIMSPSAATDNAPMPCPFCDFIEFAGDSAALVKHVDTLHGGTNGSSKPNSNHSQQPAAVSVNSRSNMSHYPGASSAASSATGREVCPVCQARFSDPIDLVTHFETSHGGSDNSRNSAGQQSAVSSSGSDCTLS